MRVLLIRDDVVENVISADSIERAEQFFPDCTCIDADTTEAGIGWRMINGEWVAPPPPEAPLVEVASVSPRQIRQAMTRAGLRANVEAAVAAGDSDLQDWWNYSTTFERNHPAVDAMASALGVSAAAVDDLWILAGSL